MSAETAADCLVVGVLMDLAGEYTDDAVGREADEDWKVVWTLKGPFFDKLGA